MRSRPHDEVMAELYQEDPAFALDLLNDILNDGDQTELLIALRQMTRAFGGVPTVAEMANLNPEFRSILAILKAMGLRLTVERATAA